LTIILHGSISQRAIPNIIIGITFKSKHTVKYPNVPSAMRPVPHNEALPIPKPLANVIVDDEDSATDEADIQQVGETFVIQHLKRVVLPQNIIY
jgi:hypothetical protein